MGAKTCLSPTLVLPFATCAWRSFHDDPRSLREARREIHYHSKRHMLPRENDRRRRSTTPRSKEVRKKPSGHLRPLNEDDMENDEVVSVAIGPPATRPKYEKTVKPIQPNITGASNFVKDVLVQLGREFMTHKVSEDFVFGQYVGNAMKHLATDLRLRMQREILELVVKYQKLNSADSTTPATSKPVVIEEKRPMPAVIIELKDKERKLSGNETDEGWPDFSNLAKIVG